MAGWSSLALKNIAKANFVTGAITGAKNGLNRKTSLYYTPVRTSGHERTMKIESSRYMFQKFKDLALFYLFLGVIPLGALVTYVNLFIGPAKLAAIPEGYEPKHWEYFRHPITRFMARYIVKSPQEMHERALHHIYLHQEKHEMRKLENKIRDLVRERQDYQSWYFEKPIMKYSREMKHIADNTEPGTSSKGHIN